MLKKQSVRSRKVVKVTFVPNEFGADNCVVVTPEIG